MKDKRIHPLERVDCVGEGKFRLLVGPRQKARARAVCANRGALGRYVSDVATDQRQFARELCIGGSIDCDTAWPQALDDGAGILNGHSILLNPA